MVYDSKSGSSIRQQLQDSGNFERSFFVFSLRRNETLFGRILKKGREEISVHNTVLKLEERRGVYKNA